MTCIVAVRDGKTVVMGADSISATFYSKDKAATPKIAQRSGLLIGGCGSWRILNLVQHSLELPTPPKTRKAMREYMVTVFIPALSALLKKSGALHIKDSIQGHSAVLLVASPNYLCTVQTDFSVIESRGNYLATGAGEDFALGSLYATSSFFGPHDRVREALKASENLSPLVSGPFHLIEVPA